MQKVTRLKPCPFCGADGVPHVSLNKSYDKHYVKCLCCDARGGMCATEEEAAEVWNKRDGENDSVEGMC